VHSISAIWKSQSALQAIAAARDIGITSLDVKILDKLARPRRSRRHMIDRREAIQPSTREFCT
jgi:hypothetical protein